MEVQICLGVAGVVSALLLAIVNGANNAANIIGTAVGSRALGLRHALTLAAVFDLLGSLTFGYFITKTFMSGIVNVGLYGRYEVTLIALISLLSATVWVIVATRLKIPISIIQAVIGGLLGAGLISRGLEAINWLIIAIIAISWFVVPAASTGIAYVTTKLVVKAKKYKELFGAALISTFLITALPIFLLASSLFNIVLSVTYSVVIGVLSTVMFYAYFVMRVRNLDVRRKRNLLTKYLATYAVVTSAFIHGAQNVGTSAGPLLLMLTSLSPELGGLPLIKFMVIALCALGIALGIGLWGYSVVGTIGEQITSLTRLTAFTAQLSMFITLIILSRLGIPTSTVLAIVGGVTGVGLAKGIKAINIRTLARLMAMWIMTIPIVALISIALYLVMYPYLLP